MSNRLSSIFFLTAILSLAACGKLDYESKEFYKQEAYIICSESTSANEREISALTGYTFVDTIKYLNEQYDSDTIINYEDGLVQVKFKVGIGGSLAASRDMEILVVFDEQAVNEYNIARNEQKFIPGEDKYTVNVPFDKTRNGFLVSIPKGASSSSLVFEVPIKRDQMDEYADYAFPLKIAAAEGVDVTRLYNSFLVAGLQVNTVTTVNWSGFPIPEIPAGRYYSVQLAANAGENSPDGRLRKYKFITPLGDGSNPALEGKYMIWGTSAWSFEVFGFHSLGWMYNTVTLIDKDFGLYQLDPILAGNTDFPARTFSYSTVQQSTYDNFYDPRLKTLTVHYKNVIGEDYTDILTFENDDFTLDVPPGGGIWPQSWGAVRAKGYKYWLPQD